MTLYLIFVILNGLSILYALPYAHYEFQKNNKKSAITTYLIALFLIIISYFNLRL